jgi:hypothetical protein
VLFISTLRKLITKFGEEDTEKREIQGLEVVCGEGKELRAWR